MARVLLSCLLLSAVSADQVCDGDECAAQVSSLLQGRHLPAPSPAPCDEPKIDFRTNYFGGRLRPTVADMESAWLLNVEALFFVKNHSDPNAVHPNSTYNDTAHIRLIGSTVWPHAYKDLPGLHTKLFTYDPATSKGKGLYTWKSKAELDAYRAMPLWTDFQANFGNDPDGKPQNLVILPGTRIFEILPGSEKTYMMTGAEHQWPEGGDAGPPTQTDAMNAAVLWVNFSIDYTANPCVRTRNDYKYYMITEWTSFWMNVPGLRTKYFYLSEDGAVGGGIYTFVSRAALDAYMNTTLWTNGLGLHAPVIQYEIQDLLTEITVEMTGPTHAFAGSDKPVTMNVPDGCAACVYNEASCNPTTCAVHTAAGQCKHNKCNAKAAKGKKWKKLCKKAVCEGCSECLSLRATDEDDGNDDDDDDENKEDE